MLDQVPEEMEADIPEAEVTAVSQELSADSEKQESPEVVNLAFFVKTVKTDMQALEVLSRARIELASMTLDTTITSSGFASLIGVDHNNFQVWTKKLKPQKVDDFRSGRRFTLRDLLGVPEIQQKIRQMWSRRDHVRMSAKEVEVTIKGESWVFAKSFAQTLEWLGDDQHSELLGTLSEASNKGIMPFKKALRGGKESILHPKEVVVRLARQIQERVENELDLDFDDEDESHARRSSVGIDPTMSTKARPGSEEKILMLSARYALGMPLWNDQDTTDHGLSEEQLQGRNPPPSDLSLGFAKGRIEKSMRISFRWKDKMKKGLRMRKVSDVCGMEPLIGPS